MGSPPVLPWKKGVRKSDRGAGHSDRIEKKGAKIARGARH